MGSVCENINGLNIRVKCSEEFGNIRSISIFQGVIDEKSERILVLKNIEEIVYDIDLEFKVKEKSKNGYYRCEVKTDLDKIALSNPIWYK